MSKLRPVDNELVEFEIGSRTVGVLYDIDWVTYAIEVPIVRKAGKVAPIFIVTLQRKDVSDIH